MQKLFKLASIALAAVAATGVQAQDFPAAGKPITIVVPNRGGESEPINTWPPRIGSCTCAIRFRISSGTSGVPSPPRSVP